LLSKIFDLFEGACQVVFLGRSLIQETGLLRTHIPGTNERALDSFQPAAVRAGIAAAIPLPAKQLPVRQGNVGQMEKQQIPEIDPHPGALAADIGA